MGSEEQYLDDLLKSMMDNEPRSMEEAMQDMNKAESKPSDFSTEDLSSMLEDLEHIEPDRPVDMEEDSMKPEEVVDAGEEEIVGAPVEEPIREPEEPVIDVEPEELIEEPAEESEADQVSEATHGDTAEKMEQENAEVTQEGNSDDSGWNPVESAETTGDTEESEPKEAWKSDLDELLMSMKEQDEEQEPEQQDAEGKLTENLMEDENKALEKDQSGEDVTGLLDQMAGTDEDLSDINEMLKKVDNNESLDTSNADMLALLEGIREAPSEGTSATEEQDSMEDLTEDPRAKKKKEKRVKKEKKEKKPRKKLFGKSKTDPEESGEGKASQKSGEAADKVGFMTDEGAEVSLDDALDSIRDKDAEAGQEKKPGLFARLWQFLTEEAEEIEDEVDKGAENATGENAEIIKELDAEDSDKNKKKKKEKKKKNKKADKAAAEGTEGEEGENAEEASTKKKKKKEKKEKKEKEKRPPEPKILTRRTMIVLVAFCATLIAAITFLSSFLPEYADKTEARRAFYAGDYQTVYEQLNNKKLGSSDEIMYQRATEILSLQHKLDSYQNRMVLGEDMDALDALFQGVDLYLEFAGSDTSGALNELTEIYQQICTILQNDYGVSAEEAVEINGYDNETYTRKLDSLLHGTEFYLPGEEPVEETPAVPEDVLPDEEAFIDMGDNV
ncbi:MAG: hypothetical protein MR817_00625 [Lachnospiraceae bacterium]|nr:hypothetical protein [Lachnospiraceae bacterium]